MKSRGVRITTKPRPLRRCCYPWGWGARGTAGDLLETHRAELVAYAHEMTDDQHRELAETLRQVQGMVVLSGYHSSLYDDLYGDWQRFETSAHADRAAKRTEVLWLNPAATQALEAERGAVQMRF